MHCLGKAVGCGGGGAGREGGVGCGPGRRKSAELRDDLEALLALAVAVCGGWGANMPLVLS